MAYNNWQGKYGAAKRTFWKSANPVQRPNEVVCKVTEDQWSSYQKAAVAFVRHGTGHGVIEAVAGSGKTETIVSAVQAAKDSGAKRVLFVAFNKSIAEALTARIPAHVADVRTCNALGNRGVCNTWGTGLAIEDGDGPYVQKLVIAAGIPNDREHASDRQQACKLVGFCKQWLAESPEDIEAAWRRSGYEFTRTPPADVIKVVAFVLSNMKARPGLTLAPKQGRMAHGVQRPMVERKCITWDDQVWLPVVNGWALEQFDVIFVDEAQDLSKARTELLMRSLAPGGRLIAVGDRFQAIYGFGGADTDSIPNLIERLAATVLPLSISYRCATAIVQEAHQYNPAIEAAPGAAPGAVDSLDARKLGETADPGTAIISRTNAPLIALYFSLIRSGKRAIMLGRDFGRLLTYRIRGWQKKEPGLTGTMLLMRNAEWRADRVAWAEEKNCPAVATRAHDEADAIEALAKDVTPLGSEGAVADILERIERMFSPDDAAGDGKALVTLSSTHKFKGSERGRIFMLAETYRPGESQEETNLAYVAVTRAMRHLTYVTGLKSLQEEARH